MGCGPSSTVPQSNTEPDARRALVSRNNVEDARSAPARSDAYEDYEFPATVSSLYFSRSVNDVVEWKRPKDLSDAPHLLQEGVCSCDVKQGMLGDCWFLSSCAAIAREENLMKRVIPENVDLSADDYDGRVTFYFWRYGNWTPVTVDDQLPANTEGLIFSKCDDPNEFWLPLLEKAYAKLHGTYEAIEAGKAMDALVDLTGGLAEWYDVHEGGAYDNEVNLMFKRMLRAYKNGSYFTCNRSEAFADEKGLVSGHAYTITSVAEVNVDGESEPVHLLRVRNPWGNATEWTGDWSDDDTDHWDRVSDEEKERIGYANKDNGEFWVSFDDFRKEFSAVTICTAGPDANKDGSSDDVKITYGEWISGVNAGGCQNDMASFARNPQYLVTSTEPDDEDPEGECSVVVGLMQMYRREQRHLGVNMLELAFCIYPANSDDPSQRLSQGELDMQSPMMSGSYTNFREVVGRFELKPGYYILVPATYDPDQEAKFMIRIYAGKPVEIDELS